MENNIRQPAEPGNGTAAPLQSPPSGIATAGLHLSVPPPQPALWRNFPQEMRNVRQWAFDADATSAVNGAKRPQVIAPGSAIFDASSTKPEQWLSFDSAANIAWRHGRNIGFMMAKGRGLTVIDIDITDAETQALKGQPIDPSKWTTAEEKEQWLRVARDFCSYAEWSRSGKGLHIFIKGQLKGDGIKRKIGNVEYEIYDHARFIICTGNVLDGEARPITDQQGFLDELVERLDGNNPQLYIAIPDEPQTVDDAAILLRARSAANADKFNLLWEGRWQGQTEYQSQSEADMALISLLAFYSRNNEQVRRLFRQSGLAREKTNKSDYHINHALRRPRSEQAAEAARNAEVTLDIDAIIASAIARSNAVPVPGDRELISRSLDTVQMRAIDWVWTGWIPQGYITIVAGESGAGKTTITADIVARLTTGAPWPGETEWRMPAHVLWLGSEDGMADMTVPRLTACHADRGKVIEIQGVSHGGKRGTFSMQDDIFAVSTMLDAQKRAGNPVAMLVIDPVTSYLPGQKLRKVDLNDAGQLRSILEPWSDLAQKHNLAIVCVTHFAKDITRSMLHRVLGSAAFVQTSRSLCAVVNREGDDEPPNAKALIQVKTNLAEHPGGAWRFRTTKVEVGTDQRNGKIISATKPDWEELDENLTPTSLMGGTRGPVSHFPQVFGSWIQGYFKRAGAEWIGTDELKAAAIDAKVATQRWWNDHSSEFVEKENRGGSWMNRLRR